MEQSRDRDERIAFSNDRRWIPRYHMVPIAGSVAPRASIQTKINVDESTILHYGREPDGWRELPSNRLGFPLCPSIKIQSADNFGIALYSCKPV